MPRGDRCAPNGGALVDAEEGGGMGGGEDREQCGYQDEPSAADDRIHESGQHRGQRHQQQLHRRNCRSPSVAVPERPENKKAPQCGASKMSGLQGRAAHRYSLSVGVCLLGPSSCRPGGTTRVQGLYRDARPWGIGTFPRTDTRGKRQRSPRGKPLSNVVGHPRNSCKDVTVYRCVKPAECISR